MTALNWLHFTDRHVGMKDYGLWQNVKDAVLEDLRKLSFRQQKAGHGPWDVVLYTGDLAFSGEAAQYEAFSKELKDIWEVLQEPWPREPAPVLLAVPGNHDLRRPEKGDPTAYALQEKKESRDLFFGAKKPPKIRKDVAKWFADYSAWWESCPYRPREGVRKGLLPGDFSYVLEKNGARFCFLGINTAFLDVSDGSKGKLWIDLRQFDAVCDGSLSEFVQKCDLAFLLTHHPPDWLAPEANNIYQEEITQRRRFAAHLCGHLHEAYAYEHRLGFGDERRLLQGVSLFGLERLPDGNHDRKHGYAAARLELREKGAQATFWPRLAVKRQDGSRRLTVDYTFALEDDLAHTPPVDFEGPVRLGRTTGGVPQRELQSAKDQASPKGGPSTWREAAQEASLWHAVEEADDIARLRELAGKVAETCWGLWREADGALPDDPWRDPDYPGRVLSRLSDFLGTSPPRLSPAEVLVLTIVPFVQEAVRACGVRWMAEARPDDLKYSGTPDEPRNTLEQVHLARPDLIRRAERLQQAELQQQERRAILLWMMYRALERTPFLWGKPPRLPLMQQLARRVGELASSAGVSWLTWDWLAPLARCTGASPDLLDGEQGIIRARSVEERPGGDAWLRVHALAYLLCVAGWSALDLCEIDEAAVDHVGIDASFRIDDLRVALGEARWLKREDEEVLSLVCRHPVIDFTLGELVTRADEILKYVRQKRDQATPGISLAPLQHLPTRLLTTEVQPAHDEQGRQLYRLPHMRFRLDHNRVRELLMGQQLYRNPALAIRELYQNSLDACRYRRARQEFLRHKAELVPKYTGRIIFRQGKTDQGRPYIECIDNGVGMTEYEISRVFAVAGRRFVDTSDYLEERAEWHRSMASVEFHPNSQFGIGVLSYFMLADELEVTTRRYRRDGSFGPLLVVQISSASGLFRLREGEEQDAQLLQEGGTRVRLYLGRTEYQDETGAFHVTWVRQILGNFLRVAEFQTEIQEGEANVRRWLPGVLDGDNPDQAWKYRQTCDPDLWWSASDEDEKLLADGIITETKIPLVVVNLRGERYPKLSIDRRNITEWNALWLPEVLSRSWKYLLGWPGLSLEFLWKLERSYPQVALQAFRVLVTEKAFVPRMWENMEQVKINEVGCFARDEKIIRWTSYKGWDVQRTSAIHRWRRAVWEKAGMPIVIGMPPFVRMLEMEGVVSMPGDWELFGGDSDERPERERGRAIILHVLDVLSVAKRQGRSAEDLLARIRDYEPVGVHLLGSSTLLLALAQLKLADKDFKILSREIDGASPWISGRVPKSHVLSAARKLSLSLEEVTRTLSQFESTLDLIFEFDPASFENLVLDEQDWRLLSIDLDGESPYLKGPVSAQHVLRAVRKLSLSPEEIVRKLARFQRSLSLIFEFDPASFENLVLDEQDWRLLSWRLDGESPYLKGPVPAQHVLRAVREFSLSPEEVVRKLVRFQRSLGLTFEFDLASFENLVLDDQDWRLFMNLDEEDWHLFINSDGGSPYLKGAVSTQHVLRVVRKLSLSPEEVVRKLARLQRSHSLTFEFDPASFDNLLLDEQDWRLLSIDLDGQFPYLKGPVSVRHVLRVVHKLSLSPEEVVRKLARFQRLLGLTFEFDPASFENLVLDEQDWRLLSLNLDPRMRRRRITRVSRLTVSHLLVAATHLESSLIKVAERARALGILSPSVDLALIRAISIESPEDARDMAILNSCVINAEGDHKVLLAETRASLWWLTDAQVEEHLSRLRSLIESEHTSSKTQT